MGQKVNPNGMRYGIYKKHKTVWYAKDKDYARLIIEDYKIRKAILDTYEEKLSITVIKIMRKDVFLTILISTPKPGLILGNDGLMLKHIKKTIAKITTKDTKVQVKIIELKNMNCNAQWIANNIAKKLEARMSFKYIQKKAVMNAMRAGAKGIKTLTSGRLGGVDIARSEGYQRGILPLSSLRCRVNYATALAHTTYGVIGVKVWICMGDIILNKSQKRPGPKNNNVKEEK